MSSAHERTVRVVFEDEWLLAVDKPAGIIIHGDGTGKETLTDLVRAHLECEGRGEAVHQAQAVQRLDRETTGLVLFSLSKEVQPQLDALVASHAMYKRYLAVVEGAFPPAVRTIDAPIGRDRHDARRMRVSRTGKPARTRMAVLDRRPGYTLVACELETGRRHQIRVHLASRGHPVLGDVLYGARPNPSGLFLHALEEELVHPATGEVLRLSTDWPARFSALFGCREVDWSIL